MLTRNCAIWMFLCLCVIISEKTFSKTVYAIINHAQDTIGVYDIIDNGIVYLTEHQAPTHGYRAVDITVDPNSQHLFITYEQHDPGEWAEIELVDGRTMLNKGSVSAPGAENLAGIVIDQIDSNNTRLYTVERLTNHLFVYDWDASTKSLTSITPDPNDPDNPNFGENVPYYLLDPNDVNCTGAYGLALDHVNNRLYVTYYKDKVHYFDTRSTYFDHLGYVDTERVAMDVDVDTTNNYLYTGGYQTHNYLVKTWLGDPNEANTAGEVDIGAGVIGLAVSPGTRICLHNDV